MSLSEHLDEIAATFWKVWHDWRYESGWRLGPDVPTARLSPYLVDEWDMLDDEQQAWFKQHAALVLHAAAPFETQALAAAQVIACAPPVACAPNPRAVSIIGVATTTEPVNSTSAKVLSTPTAARPEAVEDLVRARVKLNAALKAIEERNVPTARIKLKAAAQALVGDRHKVARESIQTAVKNLDLLDKGREPKRSIGCIQAALRRVDACEETNKNLSA